MFLKSGRPSQEEVLAVVKRAGYPSPTLLQQRVFPLLLQGKNIVVETRYGEGRTGSFLVPLILQARHNPGSHPFALIISAHPESVQKTEQQFRRFCRDESVMYQTLGNNRSIKKEAKELQRESRIIIGTAGRIIDHLRRKSLEIRQIRTIIINFELSERVHGFDKDIQFILSKVSKGVQLAVFSSCLENISPLLPLIKHPHMITSEDWDSENRIHTLYEGRDNADKADIVTGILLTEKLSRTVIYCSTMAALKTVEKHISKEIPEYAIISNRTSSQKREKIHSAFKKGHTEVILTVCPEDIPLIPDIQNIIFFNIPEEAGTYTEICNSLSRSSRAKVKTLYTPGESSALKSLQENHKMKKEQYPADVDVIKGKIDGILKRIRESDPDELQMYKKMIKKHVPITRRAYVSALLFKESLGNHAVRSGLPQKTLFVNIGKNRRVYPRDLSRLFTKTLNIKQHDIGAIRVLDNYSFIEVPDAVAQRAVDMMDGIEFRGRNIVVNFAKKKEN